MAPLHPCPNCSRHVRIDATACPFCVAALDLSRVPPRRVAPPGLTRGALVVFGAAVASASTGCALSHGPDGLDDRHYYGGADVGYGQADSGAHYYYDAEPPVPDDGPDAGYFGGPDVGYGQPPWFFDARNQPDADRGDTDVDDSD